ncbi:MAG: indole-3-glycerol phosphate synthase TrpC [Peptostreptococcaceae bacterium]|nr:indole-3-glycerol phosphate synthase TrpC [Peptostreptococcaceae bacterium]
MMLERIAVSTRRRIEQKKALIPLDVVKKAAQDINNKTGFPFERALKNPGMSFICELKKASPSKGLIAPDFPYINIAKEYERAGAEAISVLTEPEFFLGSDEYLFKIHKEVSIPILRKDFTLDAYQIYEAKTLGASAILLICSLLDTATMHEYISICDKLGLSALVEAHNETEIEFALSAGARIIGVNNRNLSDFTVDIQNSLILRKLVPNNILFVAESGIKTAKDIEMLRQSYVNGVLIGETLMRSADKGKMLCELRGGQR